MGRRRPIARTTTRRCPSARKRPEARYLPISASGRPRARAIGGSTLRFPGRRSREIYRVYSQDEFLDGAAQGFLDGVERRHARGDGSSAAHGGERRLRRLAGAAMLAGAVGAVGSVVAMHGPRTPRSVARYDRGASATGRSRTYLAGRPTSSSSGHASVRTSRVGRVRRGPRPRLREARVQAGPPAAEARPALIGEPHQVSRLVAVATTSAAANTPSTHPEFGFEH